VYSNYQVAVKLARSSLLPKVVFNSGAIADSRYFALADYVIMYEGTYANFEAITISALPAAEIGHHP
jgi:hypothetical protein